MNRVIIAIVLALILFSLYLIGKSHGRGGVISDSQTSTTKVSTPSSVNIDLDSRFNDFKDYGKLTFDKLHC